MKNILFLVLLLSFSSFSYSQIAYAKKTIKRLSSKKMQGRGYVKNGDLKAANYIASEFKKNKLTALGDDFFQRFDISVNTQPSSLKITINDNSPLIPGLDFLINPASPSLKGSFQTIHINAKELLNRVILIKKLKSSKGKVLLIDTYILDDFSKTKKSEISKIINYLTYSQENPAKATLIFTSKKLTWSGSTFVNKNLTATIHKNMDLKQIRTVNFDIKSEFYQKYTTQNIIGFLKGYSKTDSTIVITAHYDHLGKMGKKTIFPGANDNASGVALLLNLSKYYSTKTNQPKYNMLFIAFGAEELGLLGSKYYTENPKLPLEKIKFMLNFDLAGTGSKGIKVVNATEFTSEFKKLQELNEENNLLAAVYPRAPACNSDHCYFYQKNVPVFYIYTLGGISAYHDINDKYNTLPLTMFIEYSNLIKLFINEL